MLATGTSAEKGFHIFETEPKVQRAEQGEDQAARLWFVIASDKQAYIYRRAEDAALVLIAHAQDQGDQAGSLDEHIVSSRVMHDHLKHDDRITFIHRLAEWLEIAGKEKSFDQLVLVAAAGTLAQLRAGLPENIQKRISAEVDSELTGMSIPELQSRLGYITGS
jgi:protein required for attachment to host cells